MPEKTNPLGAVFISYGSQDAQEKAAELQDPGLNAIKVDPLLDPPRKMDRFQSIVAGMHFPP